MEENVLVIKKPFGEVRGYLRKDGYFFVQRLSVKSEYRGQGYGRYLMSFIPRKARLYAQPLFNHDRSDNMLSAEQLVAFYESLGFVLRPDISAANLMLRKE